MPELRLLFFPWYLTVIARKTKTDRNGKGEHDKIEQTRTNLAIVLLQHIYEQIY